VEIMMKQYAEITARDDDYRNAERQASADAVTGRGDADWAEVYRLQAVRDRLLAEAGIELKWWEAYADGWAEEPTHHEWWVAVHREDIYEEKSQ
jgi:hypothetical protein